MLLFLLWLFLLLRRISGKALSHSFQMLETGFFPPDEADALGGINQTEEH